MRRREWCEAGGLALAGLVFTPRRSAQVRRPRAGGGRPEVVREILMRSDARGEHVSFDPVGLHVDPGDVVRWVIESGVHTTTAYHPDHGRPRRIPVGAAPWDSSYLINPGDAFAVTLTLPGVYDYFCLPHEAAGMVGRIVVGDPPFSPHALPDANGEVAQAARVAFPEVRAILALGTIRAPR